MTTTAGSSSGWFLPTEHRSNDNRFHQRDYHQPNRECDRAFCHPAADADVRGARFCVFVSVTGSRGADVSIEWGRCRRFRPRSFTDVCDKSFSCDSHVAAGDLESLIQTSSDGKRFAVVPPVHCISRF